MPHRNLSTGNPEIDEPDEWCDECDGVDGHFPGCPIRKGGLLPAPRALLEVARILVEMIRAEPLYAIAGYANGRRRLFPEAFAADINAARARLGLPPAQPRGITC